MILHFELEFMPTMGGHWWIDLRLDDLSIVIEWRPAMGYGLSVSRKQWANPVTDGYGEGPDEIYSDADALLRRLVELVKVDPNSSDGRLLEVIKEKIRELREI